MTLDAAIAKAEAVMASVSSPPSPSDQAAMLWAKLMVDLALRCSAEPAPRAKGWTTAGVETMRAEMS